jgi:hypothetical protein
MTRAGSSPCAFRAWGIFNPALLNRRAFRATHRQDLDPSKCAGSLVAVGNKVLLLAFGDKVLSSNPEIKTLLFGKCAERSCSRCDKVLFRSA